MKCPKCKSLRIKILYQDLGANPPYYHCECLICGYNFNYWIGDIDLKKIFGQSWGLYV